MHTTPHRVYPTLSSKNKTSEKGFCYVSNFPCTYVPSALICPLLCRFLLTQREMKSFTPPPSVNLKLELFGYRFNAEHP